VGYVSYAELRQNLKKHLDSVCESRARLVVTRQNGEPVVVMSLAEYEALEETLHLLRDPANTSVCCAPSGKRKRDSSLSMILGNEAPLKRSCLG
jgi:antitoxin YefM